MPGTSLADGGITRDDDVITRHTQTNKTLTPLHTGVFYIYINIYGDTLASFGFLSRTLFHI